MKHPILKSHKLDGVCYDIRGPVMEQAQKLEEEGHHVIKLNIGNPAPFGFTAPEEILVDTIHGLPQATGYTDSQGLYTARKAIMQECQNLAIDGVGIEDIFLGNGVSELIVMSVQALLNDGDEILIPAPDYPLWTASVRLAGGQPIHYRCDPDNSWYPDLDDIASKITAKTRALVIINPNNPTGSVYSLAILDGLIELARQHQLILFSDEIYSKILYNGAQHIPAASLTSDLLCLTFNGLSKAYRAAGFRSGWLIVSGQTDQAQSYIQGLRMLSSMRLCANVPAQHAIQTAIGGYQSINELTCDDGLWTKQRDLALSLLNDIPGVSCVKPDSALYLFPQLDPAIYPISNDEDLALQLLTEEKVLVVQGSAFNWPDNQHFRIVFLPDENILREAISRIAQFLERLRHG